MSGSLQTKRALRLLQGEKAQEFADLEGVQHDLKHVADACKMIDLWKENASKEGVRRACFDSAVMRYRRCFNGGIRKKMSVSVISSLDEDEKLLHGKLLDLADKSVAHCVDGSEENVPIVTMIIPPNAPVSAEISAWNGRVVHHNKVDCDKIRILALKLRAEAKSYATILAEELLKELQGKSLSEIYHMPKPQRSITDNGEQLSLKYGGKLKGDLPPFNFIKGQ